MQTFEPLSHMPKSMPSILNIWIVMCVLSNKIWLIDVSSAPTRADRKSQNAAAWSDVSVGHIFEEFTADKLRLLRRPFYHFSSAKSHGIWLARYVVYYSKLSGKPNRKLFVSAKVPSSHWIFHRRHLEYWKPHVVVYTHQYTSIYVCGVHWSALLSGDMDGDTTTGAMSAIEWKCPLSAGAYKNESTNRNDLVCKNGCRWPNVWKPFVPFVNALPQHQ